MTIFWTVDPDCDPRNPAIQQAARLIRDGKRVAFPTETVYGLGADARSTEAVDGIFTAKGRPSDNPLIVHIADRAQLDELVESVDPVSARLMDAFWPGPLTFVLPVRPGAVSPRVTAGLSTVAVRMPDHPVALALLRAAGCPVAAPSANRSGRPSPTLARHVQADLNGRIEGILDAGPTGVGVESTVVHVVDGAVHVLRPGGVGAAELARAAGAPVVAAAEHAGGDRPAAAAGPGAPAAGLGGPIAAELGDAAQRGGLPRPAAAADGADPADAAPSAAFAGETPRAPGMKYTHYAPRGRLTVVEGGPDDAVRRRVQSLLDDAAARGERTGVLAPREHAPRYRADVVAACGNVGDSAAAARELYAALRAFDDEQAAYIVAEAVPETGIGAAVMNRLRKAAGGRIVRVGVAAPGAAE